MKKRSAGILIIILVILLAVSPAYAANRKDDDREYKDWLGVLKREANKIYWSIVYYVGPAALVFAVFYLYKGALTNPDRLAEYRKIAFLAIAGYFTLVMLPWLINWLRGWMSSQGVRPWRPGQ